MEKARFVIVATEKDIPSRNIGKNLIEKGGFEKYKDQPYPTYKKGNDLLVWHKEDLIYAADLDQHYDAECFVFVFRHLSKENKATLSVHTTGNLTSDVKRAGQAYELGIAHPGYMLTILKNLAKYCPEGFSASYEATHHSPTNLSKAVMFVEIGSSEEQWNNPEAIEAVTKAVLDFLDNQITEYTACIGLGGSHYAERFTRRALEENMAFGHIIPAYAFSGTTKDTIKQAIQKTMGAKLAVLDQRAQGKAEERQPLLDACEEMGIEIRKLK